MINRLKFVLGWAKYNRSMTIVYCSILGMIVCSSILLTQFFYEQSTYDQDDVLYDCFYFDKSLDGKIVEQIINDIKGSDIPLLEFEVATRCSDIETYNEYTFCSYYLFNDERQNIRNQLYEYGVFENKEGSFLGETNNEILEIEGEELKREGKGSPSIGNYGSDYLLSTQDYKKYVNKVDAIEVTLKNKKSKVEDIISTYTTQFTEEKNDGFLESGFESIRNTLIATIVLILFSIYSALSFVEIMLHLQKKEIAILYQCGASKKIIQHLYVVEILLAGLLSFLVGCLLANIFVRIFDFNFKTINWWVYFLSFTAYGICYYIESVICIKSTIKYIGMISRDID